MKKSSVILMWGTITALVSIVFYELMNLSSTMGSGIGWIAYVIYFGGLLMGTLQYRNKANGGYISFGEAYKAGILMTLVISVLLTIHMFVFLQMHPEFPDKLLAQSQAQMVNKGIPAEQMEMSLKYAKMFMSPKALITFSLVGGIIGGAILSLISSGIATKKKPLIEDDNTPLQ